MVDELAVSTWLYVLALLVMVLALVMVMVAGVLYRKLAELSLRLEWLQTHVVMIGESIDEWSNVRRAEQADRPAEAVVVESD